MNKRYRVLPYRQGSKSAKALAEALGGKVLKLEGSKFKPKPSDILINWGNVNPPESFLCCLNDGIHSLYLNYASKIKQASNKLNFFKLMETENAEIIPRFWTSQADIPDDAFPIVCRTVLAGHSGDGIVIANVRDDLVAAPLYVEYKKKKDEYRVHVGFTAKGATLAEQVWSAELSVIAVQRKARRTDVENPNWQVRNHANGFNFVRNNVNPPECVIANAKAALIASGLDFGAVDVIYNEHEGKAYVLEINTAPGLEGQTVEDYANFFRGT